MELKNLRENMAAGLKIHTGKGVPMVLGGCQKPSRDDDDGGIFEYPGGLVGI